MRTIRWSLAVTLSLALFALTWYTCANLAHIDSGTSGAIASAPFAAALAVLGWWATRETAPAVDVQLPPSSTPAVTAASERSQAAMGNSGLMVGGDITNSSIHITQPRSGSTATSRRKPRPPALPPSVPDIHQDGNQPFLALGLRGRLLLTGPKTQATHHITESARSAALDILNSGSFLTDNDSVLNGLMNDWYDDTWHAEEWQLVAPGNAREANALWLGLRPGGHRITEARLNLKLAHDPGHPDALTVTVHALIADPYRLNPMDELDAVIALLEDHSDKDSPPPADPPPGPLSLPGGSHLLSLRGLGLLMFDTLGTLWGPLGAELSTRIFSQDLNPPAQLDLAIFTIPDTTGKVQPWSPRHQIPLNKHLDFGAAELITGGTPHACTLLDPIQPDGALFEDTQQEKVLHTWLSQLCLDNGFKDFEHEITLHAQP